MSETPTSIAALRKALPGWYIEYGTELGIHIIKISSVKPNAIYRYFRFQQSPKEKVIAAAYAAAKAWEEK